MSEPVTKQLQELEEDSQFNELLNILETSCE